MQTTFTPVQLADPQVAESEKILRTCVHCGFCQATCPTYVLLGDELDSPRGRIYLIKDMLENERPATAEVVKHIDRCLSCLSCMTTCPSGVHYMHLVDHARVHIEKTYRRPRADRWLRELLARTLPYPARFRRALSLARLAKPFAPLLSMVGLGRFATMLQLAPARLPPAPALAGLRVWPAQKRRLGRVGLLPVCANRVLAPAIDRAAIRALTRHGVEVVVPGEIGCCGALVHHLGREDEALCAARAQVDAWMREIQGQGLDAILVTSSGCGTMLKDYGFLLRGDPAYADKGARIAALARDVSEYMARLRLGPPQKLPELTIAYHSACSLQHGQKVVREPKDLLSKLGFVVKDVPEGHLCCGSAGTYNILEPEIANRLRDRKIGNIEKVRPDVIAAGNIGCITQIAAGTAIPVVHPVELIDWATGGPMPEALHARQGAAASARGLGM
jgi:glycolate oxidase iron-sulfur subunit